MEKRALLAIVLSVVVMATYSRVVQWNTPPPPQHPAAAQQGAGGAPSPAQTADTEDVPVAVAPPDQPSEGAMPSEVVQAGAREEFRLITSTQDIRLSNEGGCATWWKLAKYTSNDNVAGDLIPEAARALDYYGGRGPIVMWFEHQGRIYTTEFVIR